MLGLANCDYLWNACTSKVTKLCDIGIDESVCSVSWALRGTHLAIGTSSGTVEENKNDGRSSTTSWSLSMELIGSIPLVAETGAYFRETYGVKKIMLQLLVWNQQHSTQPVLRYCEHTAAVKAIAWSPHLHTADRCIRFWNTTTNTSLSSVDTSSQVCNLAWSKNVNELCEHARILPKPNHRLEIPNHV